MFSVHTHALVKDNSGAKKIQCIRILGTSNPKHAYLGNFIICNIVKKTTKSVFKKKIFLAFVNQTKKNTRRRGNFYVRGTKNTVILLSEDIKFFSTRIYGKTPLEFFRYKINNFWHYINGLF